MTPGFAFICFHAKRTACAVLVLFCRVLPVGKVSGPASLVWLVWRALLVLQA